MTFRHSPHKNGTLKSYRLNACFQFLEPKIGSLKTDRVNGPLRWTHFNSPCFIDGLTKKHLSHYALLKILSLRSPRQVYMIFWVKIPDNEKANTNVALTVLISSYSISSPLKKSIHNVIFRDVI